MVGTTANNNGLIQAGMSKHGIQALSHTVEASPTSQRSDYMIQVPNLLSKGTTSSHVLDTNDAMRSTLIQGCFVIPPKQGGVPVWNQGQLGQLPRVDPRLPGGVLPDHNCRVVDPMQLVLSRQDLSVHQLG